MMKNVKLLKIKILKNYSEAPDFIILNKYFRFGIKSGDSEHEE